LINFDPSEEKSTLEIQSYSKNGPEYEAKVFGFCKFYAQFMGIFKWFNITDGYEVWREAVEMVKGIVQHENPEVEWPAPYLPPLENKPTEVEQSPKAASKSPLQSVQASPVRESVSEERPRRKRGRPLGSLSKVHHKSKSIFKKDKFAANRG
jgi:hypothetical protein